ncbi:stretch-activated Ca2+-permeable channel component-domain-containing protein [Pisolithus thermaeus]|nr:stretch-activated Ca2+-permeable channel component-domain-containing protein [Pisolithus croceorrhizus]KAI6161162.1 stretch-activated Ca2+-permeable channel component-domain-containing protein [Pisolithus thermaeus]
MRILTPLQTSFLCLFSACVVLAQAQQSLPLNSLSTFSGSSISNPATFGLPASSSLTVSVAICSSQASSERFFLTNGSDVFEIQLESGFGSWTGPSSNNASLLVESVGQSTFEVAVSDNDTVHEILDALPLFGDSSANQAILFSPPFAFETTMDPTYPNYTLPSANSSLPEAPSSPTFDLVFAPSSAQLTSLPQTGCSLANMSSAGSVELNDAWLRGSGEWRSQWFVGGLSPGTNYTAYVIQDQVKVSGPIYFVTKSSSFPCPLVHSLLYCPSTAYAVPLLPPQSPALAYDATSLPTNISDPLLQYMTNFTTMLLTFGCGRDLYSPLQTCSDCQREYRSWLCSVSFPRCSEPFPTPSESSSGGNAQAPFSALQPQPSGVSPRNPFFPVVNYTYTSLLPCLEVCHAVDRACPYFLGISCPVPQFNADASYGVGFIDSGDSGVVGQGTTGMAQDRWGNVWCNGN